MTQPGRQLVTFACDDAMRRDLETAAVATNRTVAEEIETRLMALRLIEESMRILKRSEGRNIADNQSLGEA